MPPDPQALESILRVPIREIIAKSGCTDYPENLQFQRFLGGLLVLGSCLVRQWVDGMQSRQVDVSVLLQAAYDLER